MNPSYYYIDQNPQWMLGSNPMRDPFHLGQHTIYSPSRAFLKETCPKKKQRQVQVNICVMSVCAFATQTISPHHYSSSAPLLVFLLPQLYENLPD